MTDRTKAARADDPNFLKFHQLLQKERVRPPGGVPHADYPHDLDQHPQLLHLDTSTKYQKLACWFNVKNHVALNGGETIFGWAIYENKGFFTAQHHAVWKSPAGELKDLTPSNLGCDPILFVADSRATMDYGPPELRRPASFIWAVGNDIGAWTDNGRMRKDYFVGKTEITPQKLEEIRVNTPHAYE